MIVKDNTIVKSGTHDLITQKGCCDHLYMS